MFATLHDRVEVVVVVTLATHVSHPTRNGCCLKKKWQPIAFGFFCCFFHFCRHVEVPVVVVFVGFFLLFSGETIVAHRCPIVIICYFFFVLINYNSITLTGQPISNWDRCLAGYYYRPAKTPTQYY